MTATSRRAQPGFSLPELLTVATIVAILAAVAIPIVTRYRNTARDSEIPMRILEVAQAVESYRMGHSGTLTGLTRDTILSNGYQDTNQITIKVCPGWATGTASTTPGKYTLYAYTVDPATNIRTGGGTAYLLESGKDLAARPATDDELAAICPAAITLGPNSSLSIPLTLIASPSGNVIVSDDNGWKMAVANQTTSTPGIRLAATVTVRPNTIYQYSLTARKDAAGVAYLYVSGNVTGNIVWSNRVAVPLSTTEQRLTATFNSGANTSLNFIGVLWSAPPLGATMWVKNPTLNTVA